MTWQPSEQLVEQCARAMVAEDPVPMSMFEAEEVRALARAALSASPLGEMVEALKPFAAVRVHKSEEGSADAMIGVKVADIRKAKAALSPDQPEVGEG